MKIALICAYPAGTNHGMISVDYAFETIKSKINSDIKIERFCAWRSIEDNLLSYTELHSLSQLESFDKIIYWGDFLHWIEYAKKDWANKTLDRNPLMTFDEVIDCWYQLFLLEGREDLQKKTIVFGNTLYGLNAEQLLDQRYINALKLLYSNVVLSMHRDIFSQNFLFQLTRNKSIKFGVDCSFLLNANTQTTKQDQEQYFLYSFARSGENELLMQMVNDISKELNLQPKELKWISKGASVTNLKENLKIIKNSNFLLTDIYHCALNSIRENTPTVCFGNSSTKVSDTLSDKKKEIFFRQHFLDQYYIYIESLKRNYTREFRSILKLINNESFFLARSLLENQIQSVSLELINEINK
jgi:hypothetical protein